MRIVESLYLDRPAVGVTTVEVIDRVIGVVAGRAIGLHPELDEPPVPLFIAVLAASAAAGGTVFWLLYRPAVPFFWFTLGTPPALFLLMLFEHLISIAYMRIRRGPA